MIFTEALGAEGLIRQLSDWTLCQRASVRDLPDIQQRRIMQKRPTLVRIFLSQHASPCPE